MSKPIVQYSGIQHAAVGEPAILVGVRGHPNTDRVSWNATVRTSPVQRIEPDGTIETKNTIYKKDDQ